MDEKPIIEYEDYLNALIDQGNEYIMGRLFFKCHECEKMIPIREGTILERNENFTTSATKDGDCSVEITKDIALLCKECIKIISN